MIVRGMGADVPEQKPTAIDTAAGSLWGALATTLPVSEAGLPVWVLVAAGLFSAYVLLRGR